MPSDGACVKESEKRFPISKPEKFGAREEEVPELDRLENNEYGKQDW